MKITFLEIEGWEKNFLKTQFARHRVEFFSSPLNKSILNKIKDTQILSVFIYSKIDESVLQNLPRLKFITTRSTGFDHIDLPLCSQRNILVSNVPTYGENTVAEHTFGLILSLSRKIPQAIERTKRGDFLLDGLRGFDLKGKTLGVIGVGNIGEHVIRIAKGFQMKVLGYDIKKRRELAKRLGFRYVSLEYLLKNSDIISLHVPYNEHTRHLINRDTLKIIKKGCLLINTARGGVCETEALIEGLKKGVFAGLGLDVLEGECFIKEERELLSNSFLKKCDLKTVLENHLLIRQPNVIVTPHNAFNSHEALMRILETTVKNINAFLKKKPINLVRR